MSMILFVPDVRGGHDTMALLYHLISKNSFRPALTYARHDRRFFGHIVWSDRRLAFQDLWMECRSSRTMRLPR